jgi:hypothetical protein
VGFTLLTNNDLWALRWIKRCILQSETGGNMITATASKVTRSIALPAAATAVYLNLINDTGITADRITNTPDLKITVGDSNAIAELLESESESKYVK